MSRFFNLNKQYFPQFLEEKIACFCFIISVLISGGVMMVSNQEFLTFAHLRANHLYIKED